MFKKIKDRIQSNKKISAFLKNVSVLVTGNIFTILIAVAINAVVVKFIGLEQFGYFTLIIAYVAVVDSVINFQSWQALIKYGAQYGDNQEELRPLIKNAFIVDISTAFLGTVIAIALAKPICGSWLGWSDDMVFLCRLYSITIFFHLEGMPTGYLRIIGKFKSFSICAVAASLVKLIIVIIGFVLKTDARIVLLAYAIADILLYVLPFCVALYYLRKNNIRGWLFQKTREFKSFFTFSAYTSLSTTLDIPIKQFDVFIISKVLSVEAVAIQKIFNSLLSYFNKITTPISQVLYPQVAQQVSEKKEKEAYRDVKKICGIIFLVGMAMAVVLSSTSFAWLKWLYNDETAVYWLVFAVDCFARVISMTFVPIHPFFIALGHVRKNIPIMLVSNTVYFIAALFLGKYLGLYGIAIAYLIQMAIVVVAKIVIINKQTESRFFGHSK